MPGLWDFSIWDYWREKSAAIQISPSWEKSNNSNMLLDIPRTKLINLRSLHLLSHPLQLIEISTCWSKIKGQCCHCLNQMLIHVLFKVLYIRLKLRSPWRLFNAKGCCLNTKTSLWLIALYIHGRMLKPFGKEDHTVCLTVCCLNLLTHINDNETYVSSSIQLVLPKFIRDLLLFVAFSVYILLQIEFRKYWKYQQKYISKPLWCCHLW